MKEKSAFEPARRAFIKNSARITGAASMLAMPGGLTARIQHRSKNVLEKNKLTLGFMPLNDCAGLVIAKEKGYFEKHGLDVDLKKQSSWSGIRDNVMLGALDGAHMLATMPIATTLGIGTVKKPTIAPFTMALNGNAITVSHELYARMLEADPQAMSEAPVSARALKKVIDADKKAARPRMTFATVFPVSTHSYELRYWMAAAGIDPDKDIRLSVIPPAYIVDNLEARSIVGCCVGEPWNGLAVNAGVGRTLITKYEIWNNSPEKVFAVNEKWADQHPHTLNATIKALIEASCWLDKAENRLETADILSQQAYVNAPSEVIKMSILGTFQYARHLDPQALPDFNVFSRYAANYPWLSHAQWFIGQMIRWGQIDRALSIQAIAASVYRPDLYRQAAAQLGIDMPEISVKQEGIHDRAWLLTAASRNISMGRDKFFDNRTFNPAGILDYIYDFEIKNTSLAKQQLQSLNV